MVAIFFKLKKKINFTFKMLKQLAEPILPPFINITRLVHPIINE